MREAMEATEPASVEQTLTQKQEITYECCLSHVGALFRAYSSHLFEALTRILETPSCACDGLFSALSLTLLSFALNVKGFEVGVVYAVWSGVGMAFIVTIEIIWQQREQWNGKDIGLPLALYLSWWYAPAFSVKSWAALRGYAGCEMLALSNCLLRRTDQITCAVFTPIDSLEHFKPQ